MVKLGKKQFFYERGYFIKMGESLWEEIHDDGTINSYDELKVDDEYVILTDQFRFLRLRLPINGGWCEYTSDGSEMMWCKLFKVTV